MILIGLTALGRAAATQSVPDPDAAREVFQWLNQFRTQNGIAPLEWDERLAQAALAHAYLCSKNPDLSHQYSGEPVLSLRLAKEEIRLNRAGENLASDITPRGAHDGLLQSAPHRLNMLSSDFNSVGIAVVQSGDKYYVVEDFAHVLPDLSISQFEEQLAKEFDSLREQSKALPLKHWVSTEMRSAACEMASHDEVSAKGPVVSGARYILAFTTTDARQLPSDLVQLRHSGELSGYALGACFASSQTYPNGVYWVTMAVFPRVRQARTQ